ncbi:hypothetical protein Ciccas_013067, partial [Cichlidogyrus casuarinus]
SNAVGHLLGPDGTTAKYIQECFGVTIMIRGKGSVRDRHCEMANMGKPNWEHLNEDLHIIITAEDSENRAKARIKATVDCVKKFLYSTPDDNIKQMQLLEVASSRDLANRQYTAKCHLNASMACNSPTLLGPNFYPRVPLTPMSYSRFQQNNIQLLPPPDYMLHGTRMVVGSKTDNHSEVMNEFSNGNFAKEHVISKSLFTQNAPDSSMAQNQFFEPFNYPPVSRFNNFVPMGNFMGPECQIPPASPTDQSFFNPASHFQNTQPVLYNFNNNIGEVINSVHATQASQKPGKSGNRRRRNQSKKASQKNLRVDEDPTNDSISEIQTDSVAQDAIFSSPTGP